MKKLSILAAAAAVGAAGVTAVPVQAADLDQISGQLKANGYAVVGTAVSNPEELKNILSELSDKFCNIHFDWNDCPVITPPGENQPDTDQPGSDQPGTGEGDTDVPDTDQPGAGEGDTDLPDTDQPGSGDGGTDLPDTDQPGSDAEKPGEDNNGPGTETRTYAEQVADLVNAERAKAGLSALTIDKGIETAALVRAKEIETSFSHTRPNGSSFSTVLTENGISYRGSGENIAWGQRSPEEVMNGWMNSEGHRANILNPNFTKIGVGYYQNSAGQNYWTQLFTY